MSKKNTRRIALLIIISTLTFIPARGVSANWYVKYEQGDFNGIWATIFTPAYSPYTPMGSGQSHSVTTPGPYWIQAGWLYYPSAGAAQKYWEYCAENCDIDGSQYRLQYLGNQAWGSGIKYEISQENSMGAKTWCVWVDGVRLMCKDNIRIAPAIVMIQ